MYVCGPTVYDVGHLGHARSAVCFDLIRRYLLYKNYKVTFVSNITDIDDKLIKRAAELGISESELAIRVIPEYERDYGMLAVLPPDAQPRATQYIPQIIALIEGLLKKGAAYVTEDGVYFEVGKFYGYGKLSHQKSSDLLAGARIAVDEKKKHAADFALWKKQKPGEPAWKGPAGMMGRPGWHIECSAMSMDILGETFDIHGGGIDLQFPHHEDEIAQSEMATGKAFVRYWLHNGHIKINNEKMSKSLGNFFTIKEIFEKYNPVVVRYFLLSTHYRMPIDFSDDLLEQAKQSLSRLHDFMRRLQHYSTTGNKVSGNISAAVEKAKKKFEAAMDDDFEISSALAAIFDFIKEINTAMDDANISSQELNAVLKTMNHLDEVLAVLAIEDEVEDEILKLIEERNKARAKKDFKRADAIRKQLKNKSIELEDTSTGTIWKRIL